MSDVLWDLSAVFLGKRLKRLGEQIQERFATLITDAGLPMKPAHMPLLAALEARAMTVGQLAGAVGVSQPDVTRRVSQLVRLGLVQSQHGKDQRERKISLTPAGYEALAYAKQHVWPQVEEVVNVLLNGKCAEFLERLAGLEAALEATPVERLRTGPNSQVLEDW